MKFFRRKYDAAGVFLILPGILYIFSFLPGGWTGGSKALMIFGLAFVIIGFFVRKRIRWLAYFAYVLALIGMLVTLISMGTSSIGAWWWALIMIQLALAVFYLFRILWAPKQPAT